MAKNELNVDGFVSINGNPARRNSPMEVGSQINVTSADGFTAIAGPVVSIGKKHGTAQEARMRISSVIPGRFYSGKTVVDASEWLQPGYVVDIKIVTTKNLRLVVVV